MVNEYWLKRRYIGRQMRDVTLRRQGQGSISTYCPVGGWLGVGQVGKWGMSGDPGRRGIDPREVETPRLIAA